MVMPSRLGLRPCCERKARVEASRLESVRVLVEEGRRGEEGGLELIYDTFLSGPELTLQSSRQGQPLFRL